MLKKESRALVDIGMLNWAPAWVYKVTVEKDLKGMILSLLDDVICTAELRFQMHCMQSLSSQITTIGLDRIGSNGIGSESVIGGSFACPSWSTLSTCGVQLLFASFPSEGAISLNSNAIDLHRPTSLQWCVQRLNRSFDWEVRMDLSSLYDVHRAATCPSNFLFQRSKPKNYKKL